MNLAPVDRRKILDNAVEKTVHAIVRAAYWRPNVVTRRLNPTRNRLAN